MLKFLRKRENVKRIMWVLALLIIPAFILWGSSSSIRQKGLPKYAGKIFGKKISFRQYEQAYFACRNQGLLIYGEDFNEIIETFNMQESAWERLILLYAAKKQKIKVSNKEVIDFIERYPLFQEEGVFSRRKYNTLINYIFRTSPRDFEEQIRELLKIYKLKDEISNKVELTEEEIKKAYVNENEKAKVLYVFFDPQTFTEEVQPAYEEIEDYYQNHKNEFKKPEQVNAQYIALYFDQAPSEIDVSEEEIRNYYQKYSQEFSEKDKKGKESIKPLETVKAQIKDKLTREKTRTLLEDKAWQIYDEIADNAALFNEIANKNQLEVKETGFFGPQDTIPEIGLSYEFLNAAFALKIGQVSNIIETPKGFFIIKLKERKESYIPALEETKKEVELAVIKQKSGQLAKNKGEQALAQIEKIMQEEKINFSKTAEKFSLTIKETEEFSRESYISGIGRSPEFSRIAFSLEPGGISGLITVPNGYCILSLKEIIPIDEEKFAQEKEEFAKKFLERKKAIFFNNWLIALKGEANLVSNIENQALPR